MPRRRNNRSDKNLPESAQVFRYFVDLRDLRDGSTRALPLRTAIKLCIPTKKGQVVDPSEKVLRIEDGAMALEARTFDELVIQLRQEYPDEIYERTLHRERDYEAERAVDELVRLIAEAALKQHFREKDERTGLGA